MKSAEAIVYAAVVYAVPTHQYHPSSSPSSSSQANLASQRPPGTPAELAQSVEGNVAVLMDELRVVVASPLFAEAATAAVATVLGMQMQGLANTMAGGEVPLVKLLPMVARSADELAAQQQSIDARVGALEVVQRVALVAFAGGF